MIRMAVAVWEEEDPIATESYVKKIARKIIKNSEHRHDESKSLISNLGSVSFVGTAAFVIFSLISEGQAKTIDISVSLTLGFVLIACIFAAIEGRKTSWTRLYQPKEIEKEKES
jgi:hypothetical protein